MTVKVFTYQRATTVHENQHPNSFVVSRNGCEVSEHLPAVLPIGETNPNVLVPANMVAEGVLAITEITDYVA